MELAPGVVAMPNMSRRSLHRNYSTEYLRFGKQDNLHETIGDEVDEHVAMDTEYHPSTIYKKLNFEDNSEYVISKSSSSTGTVTVWSRITAVVVTVMVVVLLYPATYVLGVQRSLFLSLGKRLHTMVSRVMLMDTWLLRGNRSRKRGAIILLCLLPLLLLGGKCSNTWVKLDYSR